MEAQENIAKLIEHFVAKEGVKTVFEEGYEGPVPTDEYFGFIKEPALKQKVSYFLLDRLRIGGAEYAHINRHSRLDTKLETPDPSQKMNRVSSPESRVPNNDWELIGADSMKLHRANVDEYRFSAEKKQSIGRDLQELDKELQGLVVKRFPKELYQWLKVKEQFDAKKLDLFTYLGRTMSLVRSKEHGVRNGNSPYAVHRTPYEDAAVPLLRFILEAVRSNDPGVIEKAKRIDAREVFGELIKLEDAVAGTYLKEATDQKLFEYYKILKLLKRLNELEVTQEEYEAARVHLATFNTRSFGKFIHQNSSKPLVLSKQWERSIQDAVRFYEIAKERGHSLSETLDKYLIAGTADHRQETRDQKLQSVVSGLQSSKLAGIEPAILVYGGFHKENIKRIFEAKGISYVVVSPRITKSSPRHQDYYKRLMTEGQLPFEVPFQLASATRTIPILAESYGRSEIQALYDAARLHPDVDVQLLDRYLTVTASGGSSQAIVSTIRRGSAAPHLSVSISRSQVRKKENEKLAPGKSSFSVRRPDQNFEIDRMRRKLEDLVQSLTELESSVAQTAGQLRVKLWIWALPVMVILWVLEAWRHYDIFYSLVIKLNQSFKQELSEYEVTGKRLISLAPAARVKILKDSPNSFDETLPNLLKEISEKMGKRIDGMGTSQQEEASDLSDARRKLDRAAFVFYAQLQGVKEYKFNKPEMLKDKWINQDWLDWTEQTYALVACEAELFTRAALFAEDLPENSPDEEALSALFDSLGRISQTAQKVIDLTRPSKSGFIPRVRSEARQSFQERVLNLRPGLNEGQARSEVRGGEAAQPAGPLSLEDLLGKHSEAIEWILQAFENDHRVKLPSNDPGHLKIRVILDIRSTEEALHAAEQRRAEDITLLDKVKVEAATANPGEESHYRNWRKKVEETIAQHAAEEREGTGRIQLLRKLQDAVKLFISAPANAGYSEYIGKRDWVLGKLREAEMWRSLEEGDRKLGAHFSSDAFLKGFFFILLQKQCTPGDLQAALETGGPHAIDLKDSLRTSGLKQAMSPAISDVLRAYYLKAYITSKTITVKSYGRNVEQSLTGGREVSLGTIVNAYGTLRSRGMNDQQVYEFLEKALRDGRDSLAAFERGSRMNLAAVINAALGTRSEVREEKGTPPDAETGHDTFASGSALELVYAKHKPHFTSDYSPTRGGAKEGSTRSEMRSVLDFGTWNPKTLHWLNGNVFEVPGVGLRIPKEAFSSAQGNSAGVKVILGKIGLGKVALTLSHDGNRWSVSGEKRLIKYAKSDPVTIELQHERTLGVGRFTTDQQPFGANKVDYQLAISENFALDLSRDHVRIAVESDGSAVTIFDDSKKGTYLEEKGAQTLRNNLSRSEVREFLPEQERANQGLAVLKALVQGIRLWDGKDTQAILTLGREVFEDHANDWPDVSLRAALSEKFRQGFGFISGEKANPSAAQAVFAKVASETNKEYQRIAKARTGLLETYIRRYGLFWFDTKTKEYVFLQGTYKKYAVGSRKISIRTYAERRFSVLWEAFRAVDHQIESELDEILRLRGLAEKLKGHEKLFEQAWQSGMTGSLERPVDITEADWEDLVATVCEVMPGLRTLWIDAKEAAQAGLLAVGEAVTQNKIFHAYANVSQALRLMDRRIADAGSIIRKLEQGRLAQMRIYLKSVDQDLKEKLDRTGRAAGRDEPAFRKNGYALRRMLANKKEPEFHGLLGLIAGAMENPEKRTLYLNLAQKKVEAARQLHDWMNGYRQAFKRLRLSGLESPQATETAFREQCEAFLKRRKILAETSEAKLWKLRFYQAVMVPLFIDAPKNTEAAVAELALDVQVQATGDRIPNPVFEAFSILIYLAEVQDIDAVMHAHSIVSKTRLPSLYKFLETAKGKRIDDLKAAGKLRALEALAQDLKIGPDELPSVSRFARSEVRGTHETTAQAVPVDSGLPSGVSPQSGGVHSKVRNEETERWIQIRSRPGIHARPSRIISVVSKALADAENLKIRIYFQRFDDKFRTDAKSEIDLFKMALGNGTTIRVFALGGRSESLREAALDIIEDLLRDENVLEYLEPKSFLHRIFDLDEMPENVLPNPRGTEPSLGMLADIWPKDSARSEVRSVASQSQVDESAKKEEIYPEDKVKVVESTLLGTKLYSTVLTDGQGHYLLVQMADFDLLGNWEIHYDSFITDYSGQRIQSNYQQDFSILLDSRGQVDAKATIKNEIHEHRTKDLRNPWVKPLLKGWLKQLEGTILNANNLVLKKGDALKRLALKTLREVPIEDEETGQFVLPTSFDSSKRFVTGDKVPFREYRQRYTEDLYFKFSRLILQKIRYELETSWQPIPGKMDPDGNDRLQFSEGWRALYYSIGNIVENLDQHEYLQDPTRIYLKVYATDRPSKGVMVKFWGPAPKSVPLPEELTAQEFFSSAKQPWPKGHAPDKARSKITTGEGRGVSNMFSDLEVAEKDFHLPAGEHILASWRNARLGEGPKQGGHIISLFIPIPPVREINDSDHNDASLKTETFRSEVRADTRREFLKQMVAFTVSGKVLPDAVVSEAALESSADMIGPGMGAVMQLGGYLAQFIGTDTTKKDAWGALWQKPAEQVATWNQDFEAVAAQHKNEPLVRLVLGLREEALKCIKKNLEVETAAVAATSKSTLATIISSPSVMLAPEIYFGHQLALTKPEQFSFWEFIRQTAHQIAPFKHLDPAKEFETALKNEWNFTKYKKDLLNRVIMPGWDKAAERARVIAEELGTPTPDIASIRQQAMVSFQRWIEDPASTMQHSLRGEAAPIPDLQSIEKVGYDAIEAKIKDIFDKMVSKYGEEAQYSYPREAISQKVGEFLTSGHQRSFADLIAECHKMFEVKINFALLDKQIMETIKQYHNGDEQSQHGEFIRWRNDAFTRLKTMPLEKFDALNWDAFRSGLQNRMITFYRQLPVDPNTGLNVSKGFLENGEYARGQWILGWDNLSKRLEMDASRTPLMVDLWVSPNGELVSFRWGSQEMPRNLLKPDERVALEKEWPGLESMKKDFMPSHYKLEIPVGMLAAAIKRVMLLTSSWKKIKPGALSSSPWPTLMPERAGAFHGRSEAREQINTESGVRSPAAESAVRRMPSKKRSEARAEDVFSLKQPVVFSIEAGDLAELKNWPELLAIASFTPKLVVAVTGTGNARSGARSKELSYFVTVLQDEQIKSLPKNAPVFHFGNMTENADAVRARIAAKLGRPLKALLGIAPGSFLLPGLLLDEQVADAALSRRGGFLFDDGRFTGRFLEVLFQSFEVISSAA